MKTDTKTLSNPLARKLRRIGASERVEEAVAFIRRFYRENGLSAHESKARQKAVAKELRKTGHYDHTAEELAFGARVAWRNHARCIGRLFWESLEVVDCRDVTEPDEMVGHMVEHAREAFGDGRIRSMITVFAPVTGDTLPAYVESGQLIEYAGYVGADGAYTGDQKNIDITRIAMGLGWVPPDPVGHFDVLPLIVRDTEGRRRLYEMPKDVLNEVDITHPDNPGLGELGLKWYAVPIISGMIMSIGGIDYPCAPFNGYYMCTEIASRDFADENRYDLLETAAQVLGFTPQADPMLWKDRTLTELNRAVMHSFKQAGVTITDHHTASEQYMEFMRREQSQGRHPPGLWEWIVPPQASSACPVFHLEMNDTPALPNFYYSKAIDGEALRPCYEDEYRNKWLVRWDRTKRRSRSWIQKAGMGGKRSDWPICSRDAAIHC